MATVCYSDAFPTADAEQLARLKKTLPDGINEYSLFEYRRRLEIIDPSFKMDADDFLWFVEHTPSWADHHRHS